VSPAQRRREHLRVVWLEFGQRCWPFLGAAQLGGHNRSAGVSQVELTYASQVPEAVARAELRGQPCRQPLEHLLPVARPPLTVLFDLDDLPADKPVGVNHGRVHRASDVTARRLNDLGNSLEKVFFTAVGQLRHDGRAPPFGVRDRCRVLLYAKYVANAMRLLRGQPGGSLSSHFALRIPAGCGWPYPNAGAGRCLVGPDCSPELILSLHGVACSKEASLPALASAFLLALGLNGSLERQRRLAC